MQPPHPKSHALAVQAELQVLIFDVFAGGWFPGDLMCSTSFPSFNAGCRSGLLMPTKPACLKRPIIVLFKII